MLSMNGHIKDVKKEKITKLFSYICLPMLGVVLSLCPLNVQLSFYFHQNFPSTSTILLFCVLGILFLLSKLNSKLRTGLKFFYYCFIKFNDSSKNQQTRLEVMYSGQCDVYDNTRGWLLRGRRSMLKLCAAQLNLQFNQYRKSKKPKPLIWLDIGGGTGWNIEKMNSHFPIDQFTSVYLVDLSPSMCKMAEQRFQRLRWSNVEVICQDGAEFRLPLLPSPEGQIGLVTLSYSLSLIDNFYKVIDRIEALLDPQFGLFGIVDFYASARLEPTGERHSEWGSSPRRQCNWFGRWFWPAWFELDYIYLHPTRRDYVEHKFSTIKEFNTRNILVPYLLQIPYYFWLGRSQRHLPSSAQSPTNWRLPYNQHHRSHAQFKSYIYAFNWEDPREDLKVLNLKSGDNVLAITSAGDNILHYLGHADFNRIECVDMNPHQNHLFELKLAALKVLSYHEFWRLFGEGCHSNFPQLLDLNLSPFLSSPAYDFWKSNNSRFQSNLYTTGGTGYALRLVQVLLKIFDLSSEVKRLCEATTLAEQEEIYRTKLRPVFLNSTVITLLSNPLFLWNALGVPKTQMKMLLVEGTTYDYMADTLDSVMSRFLLSNDSYFYRMVLNLKYTQRNCPFYLSESGFTTLQSAGILDKVRLHTTSIVNTLKGMEEGSLTKVVLMDHMDWMETAQVQDEVVELARVVSQGGYVLWRSCSRYPWYNRVFQENSFFVEEVAVRGPGSNLPLDRVNMYSSFYKAVKL